MIISRVTQDEIPNELTNPEKSMEKHHKILYSFALILPAIFPDTDVPADQEEWIERNETECVGAEVAEGDSPILADD